MDPVASRSSFIDRQRTVLLEELAQCRQRLDSAKQALGSAYPTACQAAQAMRPAFEQGLEQARRDALQAARKGTLGQALSLKAALGTGGFRLLVWLGMLGSLVLYFQLSQVFTFYSYRFPFPVSLLFGLCAVVPPALPLYAALVWLGRRRLVRRNAAPVLASIDELGKRQLQLNAFGRKHEDGRTHPYPVVRAPAPSADKLGISWQLADKHDNSHAVMVGLGTDIAADKDPDIFIRLPLNGHPGGFVRVRAEVDGHRATWEPLAARLAPLLAPFAPAIIELQQLSAPHEREQQVLQSLLTRLGSLDKMEANWQDVAIPEATLEQVVKLVDRFAAGQPPLPKGMLLWGPPGTGKTLIARKLAQHVDCNFVAVTIADLKGEHIGHTGPKVKKLWEQARGKGPTILFVDECESAFARRGSRDTDNFGNELVQTFIAEWDGFNQGGGNVLVIGATNRRELIDDAVLSRFTVSIELPAPDAAARERILQAEFGKAQLALPVTEALVRETSGMSGRDLSTLVTSVVSTHPAGRPAAEDFSAAIARLRGKNSTSVQALGWDDVILPASTRAEFESLGKELLHAEELARMNIPVPRGILLYGPPGTGKTQIARVLASQSGLSFIAASSTEVKGQFLGDGGARVKQLFEKARAQAPCIVFLDEIDTIAPPRGGDGSDKLNAEIVAQLLQELDGVGTRQGQVFLLAASNHPDAIDSALLSRLERKIRIGLPDADARAAILRLQLAGKPLDFAIEDVLDTLAAATEGRSGRDLQSLVTAATRRALQRAMAQDGDPTRTRLQHQDLLEAAADATPA
ncbi:MULTISPECIES: ATP-binding protein [Stenotrophomonas]|jgi:transitional endoplasmic reticulum ATPase|uniref:ATPase of the aaa+ class protein n=1 Tax=Stenotrophomonas acidaminiphila TaxID=128780 RepID=A0A0S1AZ55_9GAMM|nr:MULTISPECIES: ATP-binding protein [Stenotrophomonas]ALJ28111.1 ATPase of the aaa+ class protein [Stenotrophomonas acidaminiphila]MCA7024718.1 AAA family ATPase [Stenotrophomonas acidaminiphila]MCE4074524.1 AAA family ATPase [Stenotrophomonas acidaminiphila]OZB67519.1 MAG: hypothetical protein B7X39_06055 [Xanthomonadales bacterium 14-68-21]